LQIKLLIEWIYKNLSINCRWNFLKKQDWKLGPCIAVVTAKLEEDSSLADSPQPQPPQLQQQQQLTRFFNDGEERSDSSPGPTTTTEETESVTLSPSMSNPLLTSLSCQASRTNLLLHSKLNVPGALG
jgi:hypothetical protein